MYIVEDNMVRVVAIELERAAEILSESGWSRVKIKPATAQQYFPKLVAKKVVGRSAYRIEVTQFVEQPIPSRPMSVKVWVGELDPGCGEVIYGAEIPAYFTAGLFPDQAGDAAYLRMELSEALTWLGQWEPRHFGNVGRTDTREYLEDQHRRYTALVKRLPSLVEGAEAFSALVPTLFGRPAHQGGLFGALA